MSSLNKAMIIGNLTRDPELRTTPSGQSVVSFSVATNFNWTDQSGQKQTKPEFHNVVAWRKLAEICANYLKKGSKVYIEGRIQTRDWLDKDTNKKNYRTEIIADNMQMLDARGAGQGGSSSMGGSQEISFEEPVSSNNSEEEIQIENIPF